MLSEPEVPISSMVVVPAGARLVAGGVTGLAEAGAETSVGNSFPLKLTAEWNPPTLVSVSVVDTPPLSSMVKEDGDRDRVKFGVDDAFTVKVIVAL